MNSLEIVARFAISVLVSFTDRFSFLYNRLRDGDESLVSAIQIVERKYENLTHLVHREIDVNWLGIPQFGSACVQLSEVRMRALPHFSLRNRINPGCKKVRENESALNSLQLELRLRSIYQ